MWSRAWDSGPHIHRLATSSGLAGFVGNDSAGVFIEVEGPPATLAQFRDQIGPAAPPLARVDSVEVTPIPPTGQQDFHIVLSQAIDAGQVTTVPPDTATCADCWAEMSDPTDRRYRHPFITCTNCGPRFTITRSLPYDRPATTMAGFGLCDPCRAEYDDPGDRRFHAQPVSCHDCGPRLSFVSSSRDIADTGRRSGDPRGSTEACLAAAASRLAAGDIVAVKGIGGYHLLCRADDDDTVNRLRRRKHRPGKPLALLVADLGTARRIAHVSPTEAAALEGPAAPIVLLRRRTDDDRLVVADAVAPDNPLVGIMLASNPVHGLLLNVAPSAPADADHGTPSVLVCTSGNISNEPICIDDTQVREQLGGIADAFLMHDRPIAVPCDDSVVRVISEQSTGDGDVGAQAGVVTVIRRSRGFVPTAVALPVQGPAVLALGAELKTTVCAADGRQAYLSQHLGDMGSLATLQVFERTTERMTSLHRVDPSAVACDAHPDHTAHRWARRNGHDPLVVQHHHAHVAAVMAEHGLRGPVLGVAFDGTGFGPDNTIWGGEILRATLTGATRVAHLSPVPLPGGDAAIRHPRRVALAHLWAAGLPWEGQAPARATTAEELRLLQTQISRSINTVPTSSMGRLFDAAASLLDIRHDITFEAQAAIDLEILAQEHGDRAGPDSAPPLGLPLRSPGADTQPGAPSQLDCTAFVTDLVDLIGAGLPAGAIALAVHRAIARAVVDVALWQRQQDGLGVVCLSGGVFANALLSRLTTTGLRAHGFSVYRSEQVPTNDGGIALGQAAVTTARLAAAGNAPRHSSSDNDPADAFAVATTARS